MAYFEIILFSSLQGIVEDGKEVTVKDLLKILYVKASQQKLWGLVRHTAGMLGKRVEDLAKAVTDILVRQKQVKSYFVVIKVYFKLVRVNLFLDINNVS